MNILQSGLLAIGVLTVFAVSARADSDDVVVKASTDLSANLAQLTIDRDGQSITLTDPKLRLVFEDPRHNNEIEKILLDPTYRPGTPEAADFFTQTGIISPVTSALATELGLCSWDQPKQVATCQVEDDGGRFQIVAKTRGATLQTSEFLFRILRLDGFDGFRVGADKPAGGEQDELHAINIKLNVAGPLDTPIDF